MLAGRVAKDGKELLSIGISRANWEQLEKGNPALLLGKSLKLATNMVITFGTEGAEQTIKYMTESDSTICIYITPDIRSRLLAGEYVISERSEFGFTLWMFFGETNQDLVEIARKVGFMSIGTQFTIDKSVQPADRPISPN